MSPETFGGNSQIFEFTVQIETLRRKCGFRVRYVHEKNVSKNKFDPISTILKNTFLN